MTKKHSYKSQKQLKIEEEFKMPFYDVIKGFVEDGYGCDTIAKILGYSPSAFRRLLKRRQYNLPWKPVNCRLTFRNTDPLSEEIKQKISKTKTKHYFTHPDTGETKSIKEWAEELKISRYALHARVFRHHWPMRKALR